VFARQVQSLGYGWNHLSPGDVGRILKLLTDAAKYPPTPANVERFETAFALAACLFTGRRLRQLVPLTFTCVSEWPLDSGIPPGLIRCSDSYGWYIPAGRPGKPKEGSFHEDDVCIWLPTPPLVEKLATVTFTARGILNEPTAPLFFHSLEHLQRSCGDALRGTDARRAGATLEALERWLFHAIRLSAGGDAGLAQLVTTRSEITSRTQSYYSSCTQGQLEDLWWAAVKRIVDGTLCRAPHCSLAERRFGSRHFPSDTIMVDLRVQLQRQVSTARSLSEKHNAITLYTFALCSLALALRPTDRPVLKCAGIDSGTGLVAIDDDRNRDPFMVRLSWAAPVVATQLQLYVDHLNVLATHRRDVADALKGDAPFIPMFLLNDERLEPCTLYDLMSRTSKLVLPALKENFARHYMKGKLVGLCATETVQAFMGHWNRGTEPFGVRSGLDPLLYRADLMRTLPGILDDLGWKPMGVRL
jgi:hypothetical protein